ncbi:MAG: rod-binding protein [Pseudomonadota bacterium]|nr:rod-binding protein [Pseudomonadota bacterium]
MIDTGAYVDQAFHGYQASQQPTVRQSGNKSVKKMGMEQINTVAQDFEAFFVSKMMETMMSGIKTDGPFGGGQGEKVFRSIMIQEYGKEAAKQGNFGIADAVQQQLLKMQEVHGE